MFQTFSIQMGSPAHASVRCRCGREYPATAESAKEPCPSCGRRIIVAVSLDGEPWKPARQHKVEQLRRMISPAALQQIPVEHRDAMRKDFERQIREHEDGSWKSVTRKQIELSRMMLAPTAMDRFPANEREQMRQHFEDRILELEAELEFDADQNVRNEIS